MDSYDNFILHQSVKPVYNQIIILEILKILLRLQLLFPFLQAIRYRLWVVHKFDVDV